jgi:hypothetical protein
MNMTSVAKHYDALTPEERFRLIVIAGARGDDGEQKRLVNASGWVSFRQRDYIPFSDAFQQLAETVFMDVMNAAVEFVEAEGRSASAEDLDGDEAADADELTAEDSANNEPVDDGAEAGVVDDCDGHEEDRGKRPLWQRYLDLWLATGFVLKTKVAGWELFCDRRQLPPFALWELLPGYRRLRRYLTLIEGTPDFPGPAFAAGGMVRFLNYTRPTGEPPVALTDIISPEGVADDLEELFALLVERCGR